MKSRILLLIILAFSAFVQACGQERDTMTTLDYSGPILLWNLSQFELLEVYTHSFSSFNNTGASQISEAIQPDETAVIQWRARQYVSVVREKTQGGLLLGVTTQTPPVFTNPKSVLIVFDDGFRALLNEDDAQMTPGFPGFPAEILEYDSRSGGYSSQTP